MNGVFSGTLNLKKGISQLLTNSSSSEVHGNPLIHKIRKDPYLRTFLRKSVFFEEFCHCSPSVCSLYSISYNLTFSQSHNLAFLAYQHEFSYTLYGSFGSDVNVILNVTFDLKKQSKKNFYEFPSNTCC